MLGRPAARVALQGFLGGWRVPKPARSRTQARPWLFQSQASHQRDPVVHSDLATAFRRAGVISDGSSGLEFSLCRYQFIILCTSLSFPSHFKCFYVKHSENFILFGIDLILPLSSSKKLACGYCLACSIGTLRWCLCVSFGSNT